MGVACDVVAPSLIPKGASDKVKTDRRDAVRLTLMHRAGLLTAIRVPSPAEEAVRDLVRARGDLLDDRKRMQQRLNAVLLRHGQTWRGAKWTYAHRVWVDRQVFDEPALAEALALYRGGLGAREAELAAAGAGPAAWAGRGPPAAPGARPRRPPGAPHPDLPPPGAVGAVAGELAGLVWAEMTSSPPFSAPQPGGVAGAARRGRK